MDEDLSIINSNTRNEKIKNFFVNNKNKIISVIIFLIIIIVGAFSYDKYLTDKKKEISDKFNSITIDYSEKTKEKTTNGLIEIVNERDPTYSPLSLYFIIDNNLLSNNIIIAYEPVWAIGTGNTASKKDIEEVHKFIKEIINTNYQFNYDLPILYGGSVNSKNSSEIFKINNVDGVLVGGASLKSDEFLKIIKNSM